MARSNLQPTCPTCRHPFSADPGTLRVNRRLQNIIHDIQQVHEDGLSSKASNASSKRDWDAQLTRLPMEAAPHKLAWTESILKLYDGRKEARRRAQIHLHMFTNV